jgi:hypothetical protein
LIDPQLTINQPLTTGYSDASGKGADHKFSETAPPVDNISEMDVRMQTANLKSLTKVGHPFPKYYQRTKSQKLDFLPSSTYRSLKPLG